MVDLPDDAATQVVARPRQVKAPRGVWIFNPHAEAPVRAAHMANIAD